MSTDPRIKVIKHAERKRLAEVRAEQGRDSARHPAQDEARQAADTVTGWVDDLRGQKHRRADALSVFNSLFEDET